MRPLYSPDGTPLHSGRELSQLSNEHPLFSMLGLMEGVVLRAYYRDDSANRSKQWTEYDVLEVTTRMKFRYARLSSFFFGVDNGQEVTLAETTGTTDGTPLVLEEEDMVSSPAAVTFSPTSPLGLTHTTKMNGERVLFAALGSHTQSVILNALPHTEASYGATRGQAPRLIRKINGWTQEFANDGSFSLTHKDGQKIVIRADGSVDIFSKDQQPIRLGGDTFSAVRGETNNQNINVLIAQVQNLMSALGIYAGAIASLADPSGLATTALGDAIGTIASDLTSLAGNLSQALSPVPKVP